MRARLIRPPEASDKVDQLLAPRIVELDGADLRSTLSGWGTMSRNPILHVDVRGELHFGQTGNSVPHYWRSPGITRAVITPSAVR